MSIRKRLSGEPPAQSSLMRNPDGAWKVRGRPLLIRRAYVATDDKRIVVYTAEEPLEGHLDDAWGDVSIPFYELYPGTVLAAVALLHAAARRLPRRDLAIAAAENLLARLRHRGGDRVWLILEKKVADLGTRRFDATLRRAAREVDRRVRHMRSHLPPALVDKAVGPEALAVLTELGPDAFLPRVELSPAQADRLVGHLRRGAWPRVGIGRGDLFLRDELDPYDTWLGLVSFDIEVRELPDVAPITLVEPVGITHYGEPPEEELPLEALANLCTWMGDTRLVLAYRGTLDHHAVLVDGEEERLRIELPRGEGPVTLRVVASSSSGEEER
ncbi:hypothetical protein [Archangium lansingense]|uniref:Uncharacterized protein n=1 Tax=Archangium lansingense TaxID=2995310 RepID=A0ABT4AAJ2_9BACT|nr:hypothetical protein [Archangium lansinium]MCY1078693.1 hypothetical protein [Archangium lansinium]